MMLPYSRTCVTGASGFIGARLCEALAARNVTVCAVGLKGRSPGVREQAGVTAYDVDITEASSVVSLLKAVEPQAVFHLAAYGTFGHEQDVRRMVEVNINGTRTLLTAAAEHSCRAIVHTGSIKEYAPGRVAVTEEEPLRPWDEYAVTKAAAASWCRLVAARQKVAVTTLRLSPVYGPGDAPSRFVLTAIRAAINKTPFVLSVGSVVRNFVYIDDVIEALLQASMRPNSGYEEFNIGGREVSSFEDILAAVEAVTEQRIARVVVPATSRADDSWVVDTSKARGMLGWEPRISLKEGIRRTVQWYRTQVDAAG